MWFFWLVRNWSTKISNVKGCLSSTEWELFEQIWNQGKRQTKGKENKLSNVSAQERSRHAYEKNEMVCRTVLKYCNCLQCKFTRSMNLTEDENNSVRPSTNFSSGMRKRTKSLYWLCMKRLEPKTRNIITFYVCKRSIYVVELLGLKITGKRSKLLPLGREWN